MKIIKTDNVKDHFKKKMYGKLAERLLEETKKIVIKQGEIYNYMDLKRYCYYNKITMKGTILLIVKDAILYKYIFIEDKILELYKYDNRKLHVTYKVISKE